MGASSSQEEDTWEHPSEKHDATLYYFPGRGLADQIRWMMAATNVVFTQKLINQRPQFEKMAKRQLPFGQLPLLQIDGLEIVQSQAAVRYLARRAHIAGWTPEEVLKCDMIAETARDLLSLVASAPFKRSPAQAAQAAQAVASSPDAPALASESGKDPTVAIAAWEALQKTMREKWAFTAGRLEAVLATNSRHNVRAAASAGLGAAPLNPNADIAAYNSTPGNIFLVGRQLTYADVLVAHLCTWFIEECGSEIIIGMPLLVQLQNQIISLPGVRQFIQSKLYFSLGGQQYCDTVSAVLNRVI